MALSLRTDSLELYKVGKDGFISEASLNEAYNVVQGRVDECIELYAQVNVETTVEQLVSAGRLLRVAYVASDDTDAASVILDLFSQHQSFLKYTGTVTDSFVQGCLDALDLHWCALEYLKQGKGEMAIHSLKRCEAIASRMVAVVDATVIKAKKMEIESEVALVSAKQSHVGTDKRRQLNEHKQSVAEVRRARREAEIQELSIRIDELATKESKYEKKADREFARARRAMLLKALLGGATGMVVGPLVALVALVKSSNGAVASKKDSSSAVPADTLGQQQAAIEAMVKEQSEKEVEVLQLDHEIEEMEEESDSEDTKEKIRKAARERKAVQAAVDSLNEAVIEATNELTQYTNRLIEASSDAEGKASAASQQRMLALSERREAAGDLAAAARELANLRTERSEIFKAIKALEVCVKLMGQIKTTFTNIRIFWVAVACISRTLVLEDFDEETSDMSMKMLSRYVETQMIQWVALGRLNLLANKGIKSAEKVVDEGMKNLPDKEEAQKILEDTDKLASMLQGEYSKIVLLDAAAAGLVETAQPAGD